MKILSIVVLNGGADATPKGATVRFQRSLFDKQTGASRPLDSEVATMEFTYKPNLKMNEQHRVENPLGFQVTSYRVDHDHASAPPEEIPVSSAPDLVVPPPPISEHGTTETPAPTAGDGAQSR